MLQAVGQNVLAALLAKGVEFEIAHRAVVHCREGKGFDEVLRCAEQDIARGNGFVYSRVEYGTLGPKKRLTGRAGLFDA